MWSFETQRESRVDFESDYGRAECGPTKIRAIGFPVRSGAETAYNSIDSWPKSSGSPSQNCCLLTSSETDLTPREAGLAQPKTGRGAGQSPAIRSRRAAPVSDVVSADPRLTPLADLDDFQIAQLLEFVRILDRWDREAHGNQSN